jgi:membrane protein implicated in regulation of membrane protease activity
MFVSSAAGWLIVGVIVLAVLTAGYFAFGPAALGLPSWIAVLVVLAVLSLPWSIQARVIGAAVGGLVVLLVIGFAMRQRSQPPGGNEPPETTPPAPPREPGA